MSSMKPQGILKGTIINAGFRILDGFSSFILIIIIAKKFGADFATDAYLIANALVIFLLVSGEGVLGVTFLPIFIEYREKYGLAKAYEFANSFFTVLLIGVGSLSVLLFLSAPLITLVLAPGFSPKGHELTINLLRISSPLITFVGLASIFNSIFYSYHSFSIPAATSVLSGLGKILFLLLFVDKIGIYSIPLGANAGAGIQSILLAYFLKKKKKGLTLLWNPGHPGLKSVFKLSGPRFIGMLTTRANQLVDRSFASILAIGSISTLSYAQRIVQLPGTIIMAGLGRTLIPILSKHGVDNDNQSIKELLHRSLSGINFVLLPIMVLFFIFREPLIKFIFQRGAFGAAETQLTSSAFFFYNIAVVAYSYNLIVTITFFSLQDTATPMKIGIIGLILNIILDISLMKFMGLRGIALATSVAAFARLGLFFKDIRRTLGHLDGTRIIKSIGQCLLAAAFMGATAWVIYHKLGVYLDRWGLLGLLLQAGISVAMGGIVYLIVCYILRVEESQKIIKFIRGRCLNVGIYR